MEATHRLERLGQLLFRELRWGGWMTRAPYSLSHLRWFSSPSKPFAGEAPPTSEDGQSNDLALGEGCFRTGSSFWAPAVAEIVDHDVEYGEEGVHIEHRSSAP